MHNIFHFCHISGTFLFIWGCRVHALKRQKQSILIDFLSVSLLFETNFCPILAGFLSHFVIFYHSFFFSHFQIFKFILISFLFNS
jgi:hypothetical protein